MFFDDLRPILREAVVGLEFLLHQTVRRGERAVGGLLVMALGAGLLMTGALALLSAGVIRLARVVPVEWAIASGAAVAGGVGLLCFVLASSRILGPVDPGAESAMREFEGRLKRAESERESVKRRDPAGAGRADQTEPRSTHNGQRSRQGGRLHEEQTVGTDDLKEKVTRAAMKDPRLTAGAALAVLGVLGPGRTLRVLSRAGAAMSLFAAARQAWQKEEKQRDNSASMGADAATPSGHATGPRVEPSM